MEKLSRGRTRSMDTVESERVARDILPGLRVCEPWMKGQFQNSFHRGQEYYLSWPVHKWRHGKTEQSTHVSTMKIHEKNTTHVSEFHFPFPSDIISFQSEKYQSNVKGKAEMFPYSVSWDKNESAPSNQNALYGTQK